MTARASATSRDASVLVRLARWCVGHPWPVVAAWMMALGLAWGAMTTFGEGFDDTVDLPGSQAVAGLDAAAPGSAQAEGGRASGTIVLHAPETGMQAHRAAVADAIGALAALDGVADVSDPFRSPGAVSPDGSTALVAVHLSPEADLASTAALVQDTMAGLERDGVQVEYGGRLGTLLDGSAGHRQAEAIGLAAALVVLLLAFGSVLGALLPIVVAAAAVALGLLLLTTATAVAAFGSASPTLASMIGLGTGIDYALFLVTRHRQHLLDGVSPSDAVVRSVRTTGHAVLVGAATVALALFALRLSGVTFVGNLGLAAGFTVTTSALAALTLVPAALGIAGRRLDRWSIRPPVAEPDAARSGWARYARHVTARPWPFFLAGLGVLAAMTYPLVDLDTGPLDDGSAPQGSTIREAHDLIAREFGPGHDGQLTVVVDTGDLPGGEAADAVAEVADAVADTPGVATVSPFRPVDGTSTWVAVVQPTTAPSDQATEDLFLSLRDDVVPQAAREAGMSPTTFVTGHLAVRLEFGELVTSRLPVLVGVVLLGAFVMLMTAFRSPVVALKAAILNLLSIGAAYGVLVAVFQWQWGSEALGVDQAVPIEAHVPMIMFVVVFGLSMDYEVFLLSRVREAWDRTGDTARSVAEGLAGTGRVIGAAALIMISVFLAFSLDDDLTVKMLAVGLAVSVVVDATVVRLVLVPAAMAALGRANWWTPRWLDRLLPDRASTHSSAAAS